MYIEEITIDGFKSYAQRVTVPQFDRYFNAITGLNGSGKSNILDSICFVLGITNLSQASAVPCCLLCIGRVHRHTWGWSCFTLCSTGKALSETDGFQLRRKSLVCQHSASDTLVKPQSLCSRLVKCSASLCCWITRNMSAADCIAALQLDQLTHRSPIICSYHIVSYRQHHIICLQRPAYLDTCQVASIMSLLAARQHPAPSSNVRAFSKEQRLQTFTFHTVEPTSL